MAWNRKKIKLRSRLLTYVILAACFAVFVIGLVIYLLPCFVYYEIETAVAARDAVTFATYVDMTELKKNLKRQKGQRVIRNLKTGGGRDGLQVRTLLDVSIRWAGLQSDREIDQAVSIQGFAGLFGAQGDRIRPDAVNPQLRPGRYDRIVKLFASCSFHYSSISEFVVNVKDTEGRYVEYFTFVFVREGTDWKLANTILPLF